MTVLTLYLLLVTYKYAVSGALPVLPYNTALDRYILWMFFILAVSLLALFTVHGDQAANTCMQVCDDGCSFVITVVVVLFDACTAVVVLLLVF